MPNNSTVKAQRQSLRNIHYAILTSDTAEGAVYETPQPLVGAISASISPTTNQEKLWADDGVFDIASQLGPNLEPIFAYSSARFIPPVNPYLWSITTIFL